MPVLSAEGLLTVFTVPSLGYLSPPFVPIALTNLSGPSVSNLQSCFCLFIMWGALLFYEGEDLLGLLFTPLSLSN